MTCRSNSSCTCTCCMRNFDEAAQCLRGLHIADWTAAKLTLRALLCCIKKHCFQSNTRSLGAKIASVGWTLQTRAPRQHVQPCGVGYS
jgi:hypothetical protein